jgi:hypothetical protein
MSKERIQAWITLAIPIATLIGIIGMVLAVYWGTTTHPKPKQPTPSPTIYVRL